MKKITIDGITYVPIDEDIITVNGVKYKPLDEATDIYSRTVKLGNRTLKISEVLGKLADDFSFSEGFNWKDVRKCSDLKLTITLDDETVIKAKYVSNGYDYALSDYMTALAGKDVEVFGISRKALAGKKANKNTMEIRKIISDYLKDVKMEKGKVTTYHSESDSYSILVYTKEDYKNVSKAIEGLDKEGITCKVILK